MKKTILTLIIGILIGAIITTGVFMIIKANTKEDDSEVPSFDKSQMKRDGNFIDDGNFERGDMPTGGKRGEMNPNNTIESGEESNTL